MTTHSLRSRLGLTEKKPIDGEFPASARTALFYVLVDLVRKGYIIDRKDVIFELKRIGRVTFSGLDQIKELDYSTQIEQSLNALKWDQIYFFIERVYYKLLTGTYDSDGEEIISCEYMRAFFENEVNQLIEEENLAYYFQNGEFHRKGRPHTVKAIAYASNILSDPKLDRVREHYNKARKFFDMRPHPDPENCVKEAICALEACLEILTEKNVSSNFEKIIKQLQGNGDKQIPPPIGEGIIKLYGYRGSGKGVAHASLQGNRVSTLDAELILSIIASYITYLVDLMQPHNDVPF
jgi:hypothetical protein